ncbi:hypothetical protein WJX84_011724 [Apatococcus fuscideae]|uniref:Secreted protein n=1 Tax=Apatococcus fuscideae TaxID=2026836 RepID=A0AAW1SNF1_9CHLO
MVGVLQPALISLSGYIQLGLLYCQDYEETLCTLCMRVQKHGRSMAAAKLADSAPKDCRCTSAEVAPSSCTYLPASSTLCRAQQATSEDRLKSYAKRCCCTSEHS